MNKKKRLDYIDLCKFFAIFCVLLGHAVQYSRLGGSSKPASDDIVYATIYAFHMPLFMILSGFFVSNSFNLSLKKLIVKRFKQLIIPCITFYLLINLPLSAFGGGISIKEHLMSIYISAWFPKSLFICFIILCVAKKIFVNDIVAFIVSIAFVFLIPRLYDIYYIRAMFPFFWCGYFLSKYREWIFSNSKLIFAVSLIVSIILLFIYTGGHFGRIVALSCSITFIILFKYVSSKYSNQKFIQTLTHIGRNTLGIYLLQIYTLEMLLNNLHIGLHSKYLYVYCVLIATLELILCNQLVLIMRKYRYTRVLFLGER